MDKKIISIQRTAHLTGHKGAIFSLEKGLEKHTFFAGDGQGFVAVWDLKKNDTANVIAHVPANIFALKLITDTPQPLLAVGSLQGNFYLIDLLQKKVVKPTFKFDKTVYIIEQNDNILYIGTGEGILYLLDLKTFKIIKKLKISDQSIRSCCFFKEKNTWWAAIGCSDSSIYIMDLGDFKVTNILNHHQNSVFALHYFAPKKRLLSGSRDAHLGTWDTTNLTTFSKIPAHLFTINSIVSDEKRGLIFTGSRDKTIKVWSFSNAQKNDLELLKVIDNTKVKIQSHRHSINKLLWLPEAERLISGGDDKSLMVWKVDTNNK